MKNDIPFPNPFIGSLLNDPQRMGEGVIYPAATHVLEVWRHVVAVRSGALRESGYVYLTIGGELMDRVVGDVIVGEGTPRGGYGASHEFGIGIHPESRVPPTPWMPQNPVDDFVTALAIVDSQP